MTEDKALTVRPPELKEVADLFNPDLDESIEFGNIPIITMPAGGGLSFELPALFGGGIEAVPELTGVVLGTRSQRSMWLTDVGEGESNAPPDCASDDGKIGLPREQVAEGSYGGACKSCPLNVFGSGGDNRKQCTEYKMILMMRDKLIMPTLVRLPPSSLRAWTNYFVLIRSSARRLEDVYTTLSLKKESKNGQTYSVVVIKAAEGDPKTWRKFREGMAGTALLPAPKTRPENVE